MMKETKDRLDFKEMFPEANQITDENLRSAVETIWMEFWDKCEFERLEDVPVASNIIYPQVKHCQGIARAALAVAEVWESVHDVRFDRNVLIAGALLMDVSKFVEIRPGPNGTCIPTEIGASIPHAWYAAHRALELGVPLPIIHIITTHSPNSGKAPASPECQLLDWIDQADITAFGHTIWSRKVVHYQP
jgi:hypothetical protein